MYNAGVIGLHPADFGALGEALTFTDRAVKLGYSHIWEQLGVSVALGRRSDIGTVDDVVHHYWDQREEYSDKIAGCLEVIRRRDMSAADAVEHVRAHPVQVDPYRRPGILRRIWRKATGQSKMIAIRMQESVSRAKSA